HALAHALGEGLGISHLEALETDLFDEIECPSLAHFGGQPANFATQLRILQRRSPGAERVAREHVGNVAIAHDGPLAADQELSSCHVGWNKARGALEQWRLCTHREARQ